MSLDIHDLVTCKLNKGDDHLLNKPCILHCGHTYCQECIIKEFDQNCLVYCPKCRISIDNLNDQLPNQFIYAIFNTFPQIYIKLLTDHKNKIFSIHNVSAWKLDDFFEYQLEEMEIRFLSLSLQFDSLLEKFLKNVDRLERKLKKINKGFKYLTEYTESSNVYYDYDYENCERLFRLGKKMYENRNYFNEDDNNIEIISFDERSIKLTTKSFGSIKSSINLNARRFKTSKHKVYEFSNKLGSIGGICKLDDDHFIATNPLRDSLVVFDDKLQITRVVTSINFNKFAYPMAICSNNKDNIYVCDCHNLRVLVINKELTTIKVTLATTFNPTDICFDSNHLYVLYSERKSIHKFTSEGTLLTRFELKPLQLSSHPEIDPMRICVQNTKIVVLYSNSQVFIQDIIENSKLEDDRREIYVNSIVTGICYSSPYLMTIHKDGQCCFYDLINKFNDDERYKIVHEETLNIFSRATSCFINYFDESLFITFKHPKSHWLMKIDVK